MLRLFIMKKLVQKVRVLNQLGLHTRPAAAIVKLLQHSKSEVIFSYKKENIDAKSILGILMLAAQKNSLITITVEGSDAEETLDKLVAAFNDSFGEKESNLVETEA
jgi:phosphocarrier protein HPr